MGEELKVCVATSRKWKGEDIAREITEKIKKDTPEPKFILLFSTIHHKNEFKPMLKGIKKEFPDAPLVGGTVAGFMNQDGVFTRGVTALSLEGPITTSRALGKNNRFYGPSLGKILGEKIIRLDKNNSKKKILLCFSSGGTIFNIPFIGHKRSINRIPKFIVPIFMKFSKVLKRGPGREDEIMYEISNTAKEYYILGGSVMDNNRFLENYIFSDTEVLYDSTVCLSVALDAQVSLKREDGLKDTNKKLKITKNSKDQRIIYTFNGRPAKKEWLLKMGWPQKFLSDTLLHRITLYYPFCYYLNGKKVTNVVALILGDSLITVHKTAATEIEILEADGKSLVEAARKTIPFTNVPVVGIGISCGIRLETLGKKAYNVQRVLKEELNTPFLVVYTSGEFIHHPFEQGTFSNDTFNLLTISGEKKDD